MHFLLFPSNYIDNVIKILMNLRDKKKKSSVKQNLYMDMHFLIYSTSVKNMPTDIIKIDFPKQMLWVFFEYLTLTTFCSTKASNHSMNASTVACFRSSSLNSFKTGSKMQIK